MIKMIVIVVVVLIALVLAYAATRPDTFHVRRSVAIQSPPEKIFPLINDLRGMSTWSPYEKKDPAMKRTYSGPSSGKGARYVWDGNKTVGKGNIEITDSLPPSKVMMKLSMIKPIEGRNVVEFTLVSRGDSTTVTWAISGTQSYIGKVMCLFFNMDRMIGKDFEDGLSNLKTISER